MYESPKFSRPWPIVVARSANNGPRLSVLLTGTPSWMSKVMLVAEELNGANAVARVTSSERSPSSSSPELVKWAS